MFFVLSYIHLIIKMNKNIILLLLVNLVAFICYFKTI